MERHLTRTLLEDERDQLLRQRRWLAPTAAVCWCVQAWAYYAATVQGRKLDAALLTTIAGPYVMWHAARVCRRYGAIEEELNPRPR